MAALVIISRIVVIFRNAGMPVAVNMGLRVVRHIEKLLFVLRIGHHRFLRSSMRMAGTPCLRLVDAGNIIPIISNRAVSDYPKSHIDKTIVR
nr:MAG TPA: hypothetical protein [Caudoviricetes sp.]